MHDAIHALERAVGKLGVADVADDQLDSLGELRRDAVMDLLLQAVEHNDLLAACGERRGPGGCR